MEKVKKGLRLVVLTLLLILALFGIGITGNVFTGSRGRYMDNEIRSEKLDEKEKDDEEERS